MEEASRYLVERDKPGHKDARGGRSTCRERVFRTCHSNNLAPLYSKIMRKVREKQAVEFTDEDERVPRVLLRKELGLHLAEIIERPASSATLGFRHAIDIDFPY